MPQGFPEKLKQLFTYQIVTKNPKKDKNVKNMPYYTPKQTSFKLCKK